eukprot:Seg734.4 transcript_id=Seg734.4/GoldUCD/mRNA.D3Y31 product="Muscarinic acetylcholine receptor M4" protein_id=Seg734.4/GoldUCD/D3Y31
MAISLPERILMAIYYCFLGISGLVLNTGILVVLCKSKDYRRRPSTYCLYSILISSIVACLCEIPYYMLSVMATLPEPNGNAYETECRISMFLTYSISTVKIFVLAGMSFDRFIAVLYPYFYDAHATKLRVGMMNVFLWIAASVTVLPISATNGLASYKGIIGASCGVTHKLINKVYLLFLMLLAFVLPSVMMVVTNIKVFLVARKQKRQIGSEHSRHRRVSSVFVRKTQMTADEIIIENGHDNVAMVGKDNAIDDEASSSSRSSYELTREPKMQGGLERTDSSVSTVQNEGLSQHGKFLTVIQNGRQSRTLGSRSLNVSSSNLMIPINTSSNAGNYHRESVPETAVEKQENNKIDANVNKMRRAFKISRSSVRQFLHLRRDIEWSIVGSTLMLVVAFFITWSPFAVSRAFQSVVKSLSDQVVLYTASATLLDIFINPLIILVTRKEFRRKFYKLFTCNS